MKHSTKNISAAAIVAVSVFAAPAFAGQRDQGRARGDRQSEGRATQRAQPRTEAPRAVAPRVEAPRVETRREAPRVETRRDVPRADVRRDAPRVETRRDIPRAVVPNRGVAVPRAYSPRYEPRYSPRYSPRYVTPRWELRSYYRPYVFRPRFSIGFDIFAGYPVPYTYAYPYPSVYGRPAASYYGGVSLEIEPADAAVYVDGSYAGVVADFDGSSAPLTLPAGTHRIEIQEQGLAPLVFDVTIQPGQIIPYRGELRGY